jgi:methylated-DNA-[protein]-cysteine S-methyltransferase
MRENYPRLLRVHNGFSHEKAELKRYFSGETPEFHFQLDFSGSTPFQCLVWDETGRIPYGKARTYSWIAERIGKAKAGRAVGNALANNPFPIIIPCHRVIKKDGRLGGFTSPAGIQLKKELLQLEGFDASYGEQ